MLKTIAWRNLRHNPARFLGTVLAVVVATTFLSAALTARDSLSNALTTNAETALEDIDLAVTAGGDAGSEPSTSASVSGSPSAGASTPGASPATTASPGSAGGEDEGPAVTVEVGPGAGVPGAAGGIGQDVLDQVAELDGVADVIGQSSALVELPSPPGADPDAPDQGISFGPAPNQAIGFVVLEDALTPWQVVDGRLPSAAGEVAIDRDTAERYDLQAGDELRLATESGPLETTVVGTTEFGDVAARESADVLVSPADGEAVTGLDTRGWSELDIAVADDADPQAVRTAIEALDDDLTVETGEALREQAAGSAQSLASGLGIGLQAFAYLALVVGALIIFNTFTTIVGQRTREFALLRAIGTSAAQVRRAVLVEALLVALVASGIGALVGMALVALAIALVPTIGNFASFNVTWLSIVQVLVSGVVVTVVAAFIPAWRASRTRPVEAMRDADPTIKPPSRIRTGIGVALLAIGVAALAWGSIESAWWFMGGGATALFIGILVAGPAVVAGLARLVRGPLSRLSASDELAVAEVERNSRRTAATANALVIGVFLVVFVTSAGGALRDFGISELEGLGGADLSLGSFSGQPLDPAVVDDVEQVDGLADVVPINQTVGFADIDAGFGQQMVVAATDLSRLDVLGIDVTDGVLDPEGMAIAGEFATQSGVALGDTVTVEFTRGLEMADTGEAKDYEVTAFTGFSFDLPPVVVDLATVAQATGSDVPVMGLSARFADGADQDAVRAAVREVTDDYAGIEVLDTNTFVTLIRNFFNFLLSAVAALLGVAVVIALFGILNTLVLAIAERTRELGVLRAVGMTRGQLRRMVRTEALVTSVVGTVVGAASGVGVAFAVTRVALEGSFTWPWTQLGITLVLGVVTGVLASLYPARRAARLDPLEAIATE